MSKLSKSQPTVLRKADGSVYSQHRVPKQHPDDPDEPTYSSLKLLEKLTKRKQRRQKRLKARR